MRTVSPATTQVDGNAIYVATASEEPVSLFVTEAGNTAPAISLTLAPRHIPPREVRPVLTGGVARALAPSVKVPRSMARSDQPYVEHIATVFRALAQNRVPAGYGLRKVGRGERVACRQPGLSVTTAQVLEERGLRILAARARNRGKHPILLLISKVFQPTRGSGGEAGIQALQRHQICHSWTQDTGIRAGIAMVLGGS